ncbi:MAG: ferrous iron transporter B, partial [Hungatella sp.]
SCLDFSPKRLAEETITYTNPHYRKREEFLDRIATGPVTGCLLMLLLLAGIFWLTMTGANYPADLLWNGLFWLEGKLAEGLAALSVPAVVIDVGIYGVYRVLAWVIAVMLPPMAIFFPLFTLLEDLGYLPRVAFNMDHAFERCKACGKQCLT